jgi:alpha-L-fucosidase
MKRKITLVLFVIVLINSITYSATPAQDKMKWWKDAKFGMFIHWGLYSIPAGEWKGTKTKIGETTEWIQTYMKIPVDDYKALAAQFNPTQFNADEFVRIAKDAGMKYMVLTSKHHEGFAMFKSSDPFNVVDATPYKRDIVKALSEACKKQGMHFGLYYSQAQDWNHPGGIECAGNWDKAQEGSFDDYLDKVAVPQIKEILANYKPEILWWDTPCEMTLARAAKFAPTLSLYPNLIVNNRLCEGIAGDLETPEQFIPATGFPGKNWESCMTMNTTWGFGANDHNWKSPESLIRNLIDIASKGGNYLLNVGPTSKGLIPTPSIERLKEVGTWMKSNGDGIYGTTASPFRNLDWGRCTVKKVGGKNLIYLHIFDFPKDGILHIPGLASNINAAYLLKDKSIKFKTELAVNYLNVYLPENIKQLFATTIVLETSEQVLVYNGPEIKANYAIFNDLATFEITSDIPDANIHYTTDGTIPTSKSTIANGQISLSSPSTFTIKTLCFKNGKPVSGLTEKTLIKESPIASTKIQSSKSGLTYCYYEGVWGQLPDFKTLKPIKSGITPDLDLSVKKRNNDYAITFKGFLNVPATKVYKLILSSNDGSKLIISGRTLSNDGLHGLEAKSIDVVLEKGLHPLEIDFFQAGGGDGLKLEWESEGKVKEVIRPATLFY